MTKTPYDILGLTQDATDEQLLEARNKVIKQYSPENHEGNPLAHLAKEKIQEANEAYELIIMQREEIIMVEPSNFLDIRRLINDNRITEAEELLAGVPESEKNAEWYFLKGTVQYSRGWLEDAYENFTKAAQLNPQNAEYRATLSQLQWQRQTGSSQNMGDPNMQPQMMGGTCSFCDMCAAAYCCNACCGCMGPGCR